jgi:heme/copper-type cytochrome/quinol oxidase subunit 2
MPRPDGPGSAPIIMLALVAAVLGFVVFTIGCGITLAVAETQPSERFEALGTTAAGFSGSVVAGVIVAIVLFAAFLRRKK